MFLLHLCKFSALLLSIILTIGCLYKNPKNLTSDKYAASLVRKAFYLVIFLPQQIINCSPLKILKMKDDIKKNGLTSPARFYLHPTNSRRSDIILMFFLHYSCRHKITRSKKNNMIIITQFAKKRT